MLIVSREVIYGNDMHITMAYQCAAFSRVGLVGVKRITLNPISSYAGVHVSHMKPKHMMKSR